MNREREEAADGGELRQDLKADGSETDASGVSRRDFLQRGAMLGGAAAVAGGAAGWAMGGASHAEAGEGAAPRNVDGRPPNILFILTDQHRLDGVGAYGMTEVMTPNLDKLAEEGVRFDRFYTAQPVCAPNRATILTGLYPHSHGLLENTWDLTPRVTSMAEMLLPHGYATGYFGKWHLGRDEAQGFETFPYYPNDGRGDRQYFTIDGETRYGTDVITEDVIEFIEEKQDEPFYAYVSYYPPHPPYSVPEEYEEMYRDIYPDDADRRIYYAMCTKVDENIGELLDTLDRLNLRDNTLVVFTTEHGHYFTDDRRWNDHAKRTCHDTAARVPLIMRMPGVIPSGQTTEELICSVDLVQTLMPLLGFEPIRGLQGQDLSGLAKGESAGRDALVMENYPFITRDAPGPWRNAPEWFHEERPIHEERGVMARGGWKLILGASRPPELYQVHEDPEEVNNLWEEMKDSDVARQLCQELLDWAILTGDNTAPHLLRPLGIFSAE